MFGLFLPLSQKSLVTFRLTQTIIQYVEYNIVKFTSAMCILYITISILSNGSYHTYSFVHNLNFINFKPCFSSPPHPHIRADGPRFFCLLVSQWALHLIQHALYTSTYTLNYLLFNTCTVKKTLF